MERFPGRVGLMQMALSTFRIPLVEALARACDGGLCVFAGARRARERVEKTIRLESARLAAAGNVHLLGGPLSLCWQRGLRRWLEAWQPDVLIVEANPRWISSPLAVRWMHARGRPVIGWGLGTLSLSRGLLALRRAGRGRFLRSFDAMIAYSTRAGGEYESLGIPPERVFVAHNACTAPPEGPPPVRPEVFRGRATLLFVGRLLPGKRVENLLRACADLPAPQQPRLRIVGDGPRRQALKRLAGEVLPDTEFLGARFGTELEPIFRAADLFVLPGLGGLAVQEAMTHALPIIVAEGDGTQLDLVTGGNGWHVPAGDVAALTAAIRAALASPRRLRAMGEESYRIVAEEINLQTMVEKIVRALRATAARFGYVAAPPAPRVPAEEPP